MRLAVVIGGLVAAAAAVTLVLIVAAREPSPSEPTPAAGLALSPVSRIRVVDLATGAPRPLSLPVEGRRASLAAPAWSRDGRLVAVLHNCSHCAGELVVSGPGRGLRRLSVEGAVTDAAWSPDGSHIAVVTQDEAGERSLHLVLADGTRARPVFAEEHEDEEEEAPGLDDPKEPSFTPDGRALVYSAEVHGDEEKYSLFVVDLDDADEPRALRARGLAAETPAVSPDGTQIAFARLQRDYTWDVCTMPPGGGRASCLERPGSDERSPAWSPDGTRLAFVSTRPIHPTGRRSLYVVDADWRQLRRLTADDVDAAEPAWSPDGRLLAFAARAVVRVSG